MLVRAPGRYPLPGGAFFVAIASHHRTALGDLFERNAALEREGVFDPFPLTRETARRIACDPRSDLFFGALDGERMIGMTMLRGWDEGYEVPSFGIMIDREHRGRGLGRHMTELTIDAAREQRCRQVRLSVYASNPRAERLYRRLGFVEVERVPRTECSGLDERVVMTLDLEPRS